MEKIRFTSPLLGKFFTGPNCFLLSHVIMHHTQHYNKQGLYRQAVWHIRVGIFNPYIKGYIDYVEPNVPTG